MKPVFVTIFVVCCSVSAHSAERADYAKQVKPILAARCYSCHGALKQESGLRLDTAALARTGGDGGPAIVPGKPAASPLIERLTETDVDLRMPLDAPPLTDEQIALIVKWIEQGAKAPKDEQPQIDPRKHWAFQVPVRPEVPAIPAAHPWHRKHQNPIDAFIAAKHVEHKLAPTPASAKNILLRRVYLDLIGLPPTREQLLAFLSDDSDGAYERVVNQLLKSPQHGERWARHWMDVWRYSDWYGRRAVNDVRNSYPHIWRWRDWIINSLNDDKGYDRMVKEMLAADEIAPEDDAAIAATGFIVRNWFSLNYDQWMKDLVEHTGKAFLGLRFNCAHCHDHKYDPISQREYFAFRAFFEPLEFRHDRVPGGPDLPKYKRYVPGSGASLKPIAAGLPRIFDENLEAKTYMYRLGDARDRVDRPPVEPAAPAFLGGDKLSIQTIDLPAVAWYPALKKWTLDEELAKCQTRVRQAEASLAKANDEGVESKIRVAKTKLAFEQAHVEFMKLRVAAETAKFVEGGGDTEKLPTQVSKAERFAQLCRAQFQLATAEAALAAAQAAAQKDEKQKPKIAAASKQLEAAKKSLAAAEKKHEQESATYTPLSPTYPKQSTGRRRSLAHWIAHKNNPLTARVAVNHIWLRHFGEPLVESVFDFGLSGKPPTHPQLLDWLAVELMESGWSMKHIHRLIVTSNTYRMASSVGRVSNPSAKRATDSAGQRERRVTNPSYSKDRDNRFLWRFPTRRLEAEVMRDSILHLAGRLDPTVGGPEVDNKQAATSKRRSLYFSVYPEAGGMARFLTMFDAPDPCDCYRRTESIVPQQALAMTNSTLMLNYSRVLARNVSAGLPEDKDFIRAAFEQLLSRKPTDEEQQTCSLFLEKQCELFSKTSASQLKGKPAKGVTVASTDPAMRARESLVRVLFNHNEFLTIP